MLARSGVDPNLVREAHPSGGWVTTFIGTHHRQLGPGATPPDTGAPVAFLVEQGAHYIVRPHFHAANQFQVFVAGSGRFGKQAFSSPMVHYASAHTPYGPIVAGAQGFTYFTLRDGFDPGPRYMPESRDLLRAQRGDISARLAAMAPVPCATDSCPGLEVQTNGLGAWSIVLPSNMCLEPPNAKAGGGQFWIVLDGGLVAKDRSFPVRSCFYRDNNSAPQAVRAGPTGLWLLVVQYPKPS